MAHSTVTDRRQTLSLARVFGVAGHVLVNTLPCHSASGGIQTAAIIYRRFEGVVREPSRRQIQVTAIRGAGPVDMPQGLR